MKTRLICFGSLIGTVLVVFVSGSGHGSMDPRNRDEISAPRVHALPVRTTAGVRTLRFSGYDWNVKASPGPVGPGPNYFSDDAQNVSVDAQGRLHMRITHRDGRWQCAEVVSQRSLGYGTYRFYLDSLVESLAPEVVLGLFTWNNAPEFHHREIDIELSRWGQPANKDAQFVVQPSSTGNVTRFQIPPGLSATTHSFNWQKERADCLSLRGSSATPAGPDSVIQQATFTHDIPEAGGENARINLWLYRGLAPADGKEIEVVIRKFDFIPPG